MIYVFAGRDIEARQWAYDNKTEIKYIVTAQQLLGCKPTIVRLRTWRNHPDAKFINEVILHRHLEVRDE